MKLKLPLSDLDASANAQFCGWVLNDLGKNWDRHNFCSLWYMEQYKDKVVVCLLHEVIWREERCGSIHSYFYTRWR